MAAAALGLVSVVADGVRAAAQSEAPAAPQAQASAEQALLNRYCVTCHNERALTAGLAIDAMDLARVGDDAEAWEKIVRKVRTGMMPPNGVRRPERAALDGLASAIAGRLDRAAALAPDPGAPALHRLNRTEYANAIRDLLALDVDVTTLLPGDDASEGFDNIADVLGVSPSLVQGYVSAAMKISRWAVGDRTMIPARVTYTAPTGLSQDRHIEGLPLGTRGGMLVTHTFPLDGEYEFIISGGGGRGGGRGVSLDVTLDGAAVPAENPRSFTLPVTAGPHAIGVALVDSRRPAGVDDVFSVFGVGGAVQSVTIAGPLNPTGPGDTPSRRRVFVCDPETVNDETPCAREILSSLARRAFRRPVTDAERDALMAFYEEGRQEGDFETGVQQGLARILIAPKFLFRTEEEPAGLADGAVYRLSDLEIASRLSFFLWSSIPDDELLEVASEGRLSDPQVLERQVRRMLADRKSEALIDNFAGQWLGLRALEGLEPEVAEFDENLRRSFIRETQLLLGTVIREDRRVVELLDADYTFVDERLARHYGIPDVRGSYFRRVTLDENSPRRGLLGHGSILTATSPATRTSPVVRGQWILENFLGTPAPAPPPGVETNLEPDPQATEVPSLRARLELHRENPVCASCHQIMDPIGFSLENFDLIGAWREFDGKTPIDASGELVDGTRLEGPVDLRHALLDRSDSFVTTLAEKLLTYAMGRVVEYYDQPAVRGIVRDAAAQDYRFSSLVLGVVKSAPFQMKRKGQPPEETVPRTEVAARQGPAGDRRGGGPAVELR